MVCLYVTSAEEGSGKTAVCAGLGSHLLSSGKKVSFFKLAFADDEQSSAVTHDRDTLFMKQALGLDESIDIISPVISGGDKLVDSIRKAFARVSSGKDIVITEGALEPDIIEALDARVIAVEGYSDGLRFTERYKGLGKYLSGIVLNKVPAKKLEHVRDEITAQLDGTDIDLLGVLPEDRLLFTMSIGELAEYIQGEILNSSEQSAELIENIMIGAMVVDPGSLYFWRKRNKAVVVRSNRPDMQLAALETATRCLILCGDSPPATAVLYGAETKKVPIIVTRADITTTVGNIEAALDRGKFGQEKKLPRIIEILSHNLDFPVVSKFLGPKN